MKTIGDWKMHKKKKVLKKMMTLILVVIIASIAGMLAVDMYVGGTGKKYVMKWDEITDGYDCIIVPGASVISNSIPSTILKDRLDMAFDIYMNTDIDRILVSGDHGAKTYDEVNVMRDYLINKEIPGENIFMDHAGFDTYQTIYRAKEIFEVDSAIIVTQGFHLYRALYIGEKLDIELVGADSAVREYEHDFKNRIREYPARVKAFLECEIFKPEPEFLGKKIFIYGENLTLDK
jgi:SanA protein